MTDAQEDPFYAQRCQKIKQDLKQGNVVYPHKFAVSHAIGELLKLANQKEYNDDKYKSAGRIIAVRDLGKIAFLKVMDNHNYIQVVLQASNVQNISEYKRGDIVGFEGTLGYTKSNEFSVYASSIQILAPCLMTLPVEHFGVKDPEIIYRKRYLDLILNQESKKRFETRNKIIKYIRKYLDDREFLEVETPMMNLIPGGAAAKPFKTYHNELELDLFMRISPELYLKMLVIGGMSRVYELGKDYRNEGIDLTHNPEFTTCEFYMAYADYNDIINMTEEMLSGMVNELYGDTKIEYHPMKREDRPDKVSISFERPFKKLDIMQELNKNIAQRMKNWNDKDLQKGFDLLNNKDAANILKSNFEYNNINNIGVTDYSEENYLIPSGNLEDHLPFLVFFSETEKIKINEPQTLPRVLDKLIGEYIESQCINPTFVVHHPLAMSPLAKKHRCNPNITERFELFINTKEICNAYTELNDPFDQKERFEDQVKECEKGDDEAMKMDKGFITAMEYGLPPTGGWGIGIDRFVMFLTNAANIRDVILFPTLKPDEDKVNLDGLQISDK